MSIKIEKGIPLPASGKGAPKYPYVGCEVGDSFFVPGKKPVHMSGHCSSVRRRYPERKYISRTVPGGVRVWRIK